MLRNKFMCHCERPTGVRQSRKKHYTGLLRKPTPLNGTLILAAFILLLTSQCSAFAEPVPVAAVPAQPQTSQGTQPQPAVPVVQYATYQNCLRQYSMPFDKLYYLALASVNTNKFDILEMQSRNGYILFETGGKEFLLSVMDRKDKKSSFIKLTPADNSYMFPITVPQKIFGYIDANLSTAIQETK